jgi:PKD repeat protein
MAKRILPLLSILLLPYFALAQFPKLLLKSGITIPEARIAWPPSEEAHQAYHFRLVQFQKLPDPAERAALAKAGVVLMDYLPHHAYFTAIKKDSRVDWGSWGVRAVLPIPPSWKVQPDLADRSDLLLAYPRVLEAEPIIAELVALGAEITHRNDQTQLLGIQIASSKIQLVAALPFVSYLQAMPPPPVLERQHFRTGSRSNYLAATHGFDGSGLVLAVAEGRIAPNLIDLHNRLDVSYHPSTSSAGHATSVAQFMAGAGNENPLYRGMAYGADVISHSFSIWGNAPALYANPGLRISNQSWGSGCNSGYNNDARAVDLTLAGLPHFMMVFSTGNSQGSNCGYGAGSGWGTITGGVKTAKNVMAVGALTRYDEVTGFSSFGPATDGRIKPDISTIGEGGTSFASPTLSGVYAQLHQAYMFHHAGAEPPSGLIKAILQNTADDIGNPGPDFKHGYGKANARKAYRVISEGSWSTDTVANAQQRLISFTIPPNTREVKVMVYWADVAGAGNAAKALVNDLDMELLAPGGAATWLPWVLDPTPDSLGLDDDAVRGTDTLNNMEQVTLTNPAAGSWQVRVTGTEVPMGPQPFFVVSQSYQDELVLTYPLGGEGFVPGEKEIIRWDATGAGAFDLSYSLDGGLSWQAMATGIADSLRYYEWTVPDTLTGNVQVRISSGSLGDTSDFFTVSALPANVSVLWACSDSLKLVWDSVAQATGYRITQLGALYMDSVETVSSPEVVLRNQSTTDTLWFAVQALGPNGALSRRTIAIRKNPGDFNCIQVNAAAEAVISHQPGYYPDCQSSPGAPLGVRIRNNGVGALSQVPVRYRINGGPVTTGTIAQTIPSGGTFDFYFPGTLNFSFAGTYVVKVWTDMPGDPQADNDTTSLFWVTYPGQTLSPNYIQDLDTFSNCSTAWGCSDISCALADGWFNVPNLLGDSIDFRTHSGSTGSANTGPSSDHTQGNASGKYLYLETSGNSGSGCRNQLAYLHSPCIDLRHTQQPMLSFWRHLYGSSIGSLHVDVLSNGQWIEDVVPEVSGNQGDMWIQEVVDLSAFAGETIVIRFRATTGNGFSGDLALDDIQITSLPLSGFFAERQDVCPHDVIRFTDSSFQVASRQWQFAPSTVVYAAGTSASSEDPQVIFTQPGLYTVTLINTNSRGNDTLVKTTYINAGPHLLSLTTDDADNILCLGDSLTLTAVSAGQSTTFKQNGSIIQNGPQQSLLIPALSSTSVFTAVGTLYPGCLTDEPAVFVRVNDPQVSVTSAGGSQACEGDSILLSADLGFNSYLWSDGQLTQNIYARTSGSYAVTVTDQAGCEARSDSLALRFFPRPGPLTLDGPAMGILQAADTFSVVGQIGSTFQWGSSALVSLSTSGDTAIATWRAIGLQTLWVVETSAEGCEGDTFFFEVIVERATGVEDNSFSRPYLLFPNPAQHELFVQFESVPEAKVQLVLRDLKGRLLQQKFSRQAKTRLNLQNLAEGIYLLEIRMGEEVVWEKVWVR